MISNFRFTLVQAWFGLREEWSNIASGVFGYVLFPIYVIIVSLIWNKYRPSDSTLSVADLFIYVGLAEVIVLTTLTSLPGERAMSDFSYALSRPRSWFVYYAGLILGRNLGRRLIFLGLFAISIGPLTGEPWRVMETVARFTLPLGVLTLLEILFSTFWVLLLILFGRLAYFRFALLKFLMVMGGMFTPINELSEPWQHWMLNNPAADVVFQPAYFALHGTFYQLSGKDWLIRICMQSFVVACLAYLTFKFARHRQQVYGG